MQYAMLLIHMPVAILQLSTHVIMAGFALETVIYAKLPLAPPSSISMGTITFVQSLIEMSIRNMEIAPQCSIPNDNSQRIFDFRINSNEKRPDWVSPMPRGKSELHNVRRYWQVGPKINSARS